MTYCVLGLGSNKGWNGFSPLQLLAKACRLLESLFCRDFAFSSVYGTKPMYYEDQSDFHNMAVFGYTQHSASDILSEIHKIEAELGRNRNSEIRNGPRSMDIDIELYGNESINITDSADSMKNLLVPHPRIAERAFVLVPLLEIFPHSADVLKADFYTNCLAELDVRDVVKILDRTDFASLVEKSGVGYGRTDSTVTADLD
ncbi:MAG: 2-amino-4-hydroxy-6-hydroxymethyldihydropteridine diphosphokinase [Treponema sp.]|nr:2-amino-4-hydroxy-6-hydroxymethyldihydropteridine diphosphokinase [Candidatus Treponema equifaecale]